MKKIISGLIAGAFLLCNAVFSFAQAVNAAPYSNIGIPNEDFKNAINPKKGNFAIQYNTEGLVYDDNAKTSLYLFYGGLSFDEILDLKPSNSLANIQNAGNEDYIPEINYVYGRIMESPSFITQIKIDGKIYNFSEEYTNFFDHYEYDADNEILREFFNFPELKVERCFTMISGGTTLEIQYKILSDEKKSVGLVVPVQYTDPYSYELGPVDVLVPDYGIIENETEFSGEDVPENFISLRYERGKLINNPWHEKKYTYHDSISTLTKHPNYKNFSTDRLRFIETSKLYEKDTYLTDENGSLVNDLTSYTAVAAEPGKINSEVTALYIWDEKERDFSETNTFTIKVGLLDNPKGAYLSGDYFADISDKKEKTLHFRLDTKNTIPDYNNASWVEYDIPDGMRMELNIDECRTNSLCFDLKVPGTYEPGNYPVTFTLKMLGTTDNVIRRYITVTDTPGNDNRVIFDDNVFPFLNTKKDFEIEKDNYPNSDLYNQLTENMSNKVKDVIYRNAFPSLWNGCCYGMASAISLYKTDYMHPSFWQSSAVVPHDMKLYSSNFDSVGMNSVDTEIEETKTKDLVNYYYLIQYYPDIRDSFARYFSVANISDGGVDNSIALKQLVKEAAKVEKGGYPVIQNLSWVSNEKYNLYGQSNWTSHTVLVYGFAESNSESRYFSIDGKSYKYKLAAYDPNSHEEAYFYITEDYSDWYFSSSGTNPMICKKNSQGIDKRIIYPPISSIDLLDQKNAETGRAYNLLKDCTRPTYSSGINDIIIQSVSGAEFRTDGMSSSGDLDAFAYIEPFAATITDNSGNSVYSARPTVVFPNINDVYTVRSSSENGALKGTMTYRNYMLDVDTNSADSVVFNPSGGVTINGNSGEYEIGIVCEEMYKKTPWFKVNAKGESSDKIDMHVTYNGIILEADNLKNTQIYAGDTDNFVDLYFSSEENAVLIKSVNNETLGVYTDPDGDNVFDTLIAEQKQEEITFETVTEPEHSNNFVSGDADGNGTVNTADFIVVIRYLINQEEINKINVENADLNFDGKIDSKDILLFKKTIILS